MTTIVTRAGKGSPLTNVEVDANFTNLNNDKLEKSGGTITANSNDPALKITQTGSGDALRVEDASGDTTPFVISTGGDVYVGGSIIQAIGNTLITGGGLTVRSGDGVEGGQISLYNKANTNIAYNFDVDGSDHGRIFTAQNNTNLTIGQVAGTGGSVSIHTGGLSRVHVASDGHVGIGTTPAVPSGFSRFVAIGDADTGIGQISDGVLAVSTNNVERMRIDGAGQVSIPANNTTAALKITQTGEGNALVVEDSASTDSTPFVISNSGQVVMGASTPPTINGYQRMFYMGGGAYDMVLQRTSADYSGQFLFLAKSRATAPNSRAIVSNGDAIGQVQFVADDGISDIAAAQIQAAVDGTPGTNDMPGRLVFSTTGDGGFDPVERMRIDSSGGVGIGTTPATEHSLRISRPISGNTVSVGVLSDGQVQSGVTFQGRYFQSYAHTAAAPFSTEIYHYLAEQGTFGAGSTVTNQYGFLVSSALTGAANNYGFHSNIAAGTGRWNFYAAGTADNVFNGNVRVVNGSATLGYGTGAGGTVTQVTSKSTTVTLNKPCGQITMHNASLAAGTQANFTLTNSLITVNDLILVNVRTPTAALYSVRAGDIASGSCLISLTNVSGGPLSDAVIISFAIIKGSVA